jgi:hypothetical protein
MNVQRGLQAGARDLSLQYANRYNKAGVEKSWFQILGDKTQFPARERDSVQHKLATIDQNIQDLKDRAAVVARDFIHDLTARKEGKQYDLDLQRLFSLPVAIQNLDIKLPHLKKCLKTLEEILPEIEQEAAGTKADESFGLPQKIYNIGHAFFTAGELGRAEESVRQFLDLRDKETKKSLSANELEVYGYTAVRALLTAVKVGTLLTAALPFKIAVGETVDQIDKILKKKVGGDLDGAAAEIKEVITSMKGSIERAEAERKGMQDSIWELGQKTAETRSRALVTKFNRLSENHRVLLQDMLMMATHNRPDFLDPNVPGVTQLFTRREPLSGFDRLVPLAA